MIEKYHGMKWKSNTPYKYCVSVGKREGKEREGREGGIDREGKRWKRRGRERGRGREREGGEERERERGGGGGRHKFFEFRHPLTRGHQLFLSQHLSQHSLC